MKNRVPVILSATALVVAVLGVTPVGQATSTAIQTHFARNAHFLRGHAPSQKAGKGKIPFAGKNGKLDSSWGAVGPRGPQGPPGANGANGAPGAKGDKGDKGDTGAQGPGARWALVSAAGTIISQSGGISITNSQFDGAYYVNFGSNVSGKLIHATLRYPYKGDLHVVRCGTEPEGTPCTFGNDPNHVYVGTWNTAGTNTDATFYISVIG
jgi:hypothetical protein